jgi:hypothetical protein
MQREHRNQLLDLIPKLVQRPGFESLVRRIAAADGILDEVPDHSSYNTAVEFIVDAAIERGWSKQLGEELGREYPNRTELAEIFRDESRPGGRRGWHRLWNDRAILATVSILAFGFGATFILTSVIAALTMSEPTETAVTVLHVMAALGAGSLVAAVVGVATRRLAVVQCAIVMTSSGLAACVIMMLVDPIRGLVEGPRPAIVIVRPDVNARAMISPNLESPFVIRVGARRTPVPASGVAIGIGPMPVDVLATYRAVVATGEPTRLMVRMHRGRPTKIEVMYEGNACKPLIIDPAIKTLWEFRFVDCLHTSSRPSR